MYAGSSSVPCGDFTASMSPWTTPSFFAVSGDLDPRVPHRLRHRVRRFLEPGADRATPVVEPERRIGQQCQAAAVARELRRRDFAAADLGGHSRGRDLTEDAATLESAFNPHLNLLY